MGLYLIGNYPMQTTTPPTKVGLTATVTKTLMQIKPGATQIARIIEWGICGDAFAAATPGIVELIETDVAATVTQYAAADLSKYDNEAIGAGDPTTNMFSVGTSASGYTATVEGSITTVRNLAGVQLIAPTNQFILQMPLAREPIIQAGKFARIRATFPAAVNVLCYMIVSV